MPSGIGSPLRQGRALVGTPRQQQQQRNALNVLVPTNANASADTGYELVPGIKAAAFAKDFYELGLGRFVRVPKKTHLICELALSQWRVRPPGKAGKSIGDARGDAQRFMTLFRWVAYEAELERITAACSTTAADVQLQLEDKKAAIDAVVQRIRDVYLPCLEGSIESTKTGDTVTALYGRWKKMQYRVEPPTASFGFSFSSAGIISWEQLQQMRIDEAATAAAATASEADLGKKKKKRARKE